MLAIIVSSIVNAIYASRNAAYIRNNLVMVKSG
jgi:hypothetical protein